MASLHRCPLRAQLICGGAPKVHYGRHYSLPLLTGFESSPLTVTHEKSASSSCCVADDRILAERRGFEPPRAFRLYSLSKRAH